MPSPTPTSAATRSDALGAFLQGIEPRAWVLAQRQCADQPAAARALRAAWREFAGEAPSMLLAHWPLQLWTCLLRQPELRAAATVGDDVSALAPDQSAALLLRLIAGLDFVPAAQVLGWSVPAYEACLRGALDQLDDERIQALREQLHAQIHDMSAQDREQLAVLREQVLGQLPSASAMGHDIAPDSAPAGQIHATPDFAGAAVAAESRPMARQMAGWRAVPRGLWLLLALALLALLATFLGKVSRIGPGQAEQLPAEAIAPPPPLTDTVVVTHPDYAQLADPAGDAIARELPFLSWMAAATVPVPVGMGTGTTQIASPKPAPPDSLAALSADERSLLGSAAATWPVLDAATRSALLANARDWQARSARQQAELRQRVQTWDRQTAVDRGRRRTPFLAWQSLSEQDRQWVRIAAARVAAQPVLERKALRDQFAASPTGTQGMWWMGPALGQELAPIASLFAFVPEADRPALLAALRGLEPQSRADLALLSPRLSEAHRQSLRQQLLASPPTRRAELIRQRLAE